MNDYVDYVEQLARGFRAAQAIGRPAAAEDLPPLPSNARTILVLSPHPDDECVVGGLPLRLRLAGRTDRRAGGGGARRRRVRGRREPGLMTAPQASRQSCGAW